MYWVGGQLWLVDLRAERVILESPAEFVAIIIGTQDETADAFSNLQEAASTG